MKAQQGVYALLFYPFRPDERGNGDPHSSAYELIDPDIDLPPSPEDDSQNAATPPARASHPPPTTGSPSSTGLPQSEWNSYQPCALCGAAECSIFLLISDCPHPSMIDSRASLLSRLKEALQRLLNFMKGLLRKDARPPLTADQEAALSNLQKLCPSSPFELSEVHFVSYYILMGYPWPRRVVPPVYHLASAFGAFFDVTTAPDRDMRELADFWLDWSDTSLHKLGKAYRNAVSAVSLDPSLRASPPPRRVWPPPPPPPPPLQ